MPLKSGLEILNNIFDSAYEGKSFECIKYYDNESRPTLSVHKFSDNGNLEIAMENVRLALEWPRPETWWVERYKEKVDTSGIKKKELIPVKKSPVIKDLNNDGIPVLHADSSNHYFYPGESLTIYLTEKEGTRNWIRKVDREYTEDFVKNYRRGPVYSIVYGTHKRSFPDQFNKGKMKEDDNLKKEIEMVDLMKRTLEATEQNEDCIEKLISHWYD